LVLLQYTPSHYCCYYYHCCCCCCCCYSCCVWCTVWCGFCVRRFSAVLLYV